MELLKKKKILILGIKNKFSLSWGIAKELYKHNAQLAFTYHNKKLKKRIQDFAKTLKSNIVIHCDVKNDNSIDRVFLKLSKYWNKFDGLIHSIAFSSNKQLQGDYLDVSNRYSFLETQEISVFSLTAIVKSACSFLNKKSSIITISYIGSKIFIPNYNVMGIAKSALESSVRYLSVSLGKKDIRINSISSGLIKTASSYKIKDFYKLSNLYKSYSPLKNVVSSKDIGNVAVFLCSDLSSCITGQNIYVDSGFNIRSISF